MAKSGNTQEKIIHFLRRRDYKFLKELGQGACGKTVLLHDDQIDEHFVCRKYVPFSEEHRQELFMNFIREIKLLHKIHNRNVVRVFNYYLYPDEFTGYMLMEFIDGYDVDDYSARSPEQTNEVFLQAIQGFAYLENAGILHRDIRPGNVMVREDGTVKIIDLGFGKQVRDSRDFKKSISLNWWCEPPNEFDESRYDFRSEVYFVGKLFAKIIQENEISHFKYSEVLGRMCQKKPESRTQKFADIEKEIGNNQFFQIEFSDLERDSYRSFADCLCQQISKIGNDAKYVGEIARVEKDLYNVYRGFMLEEAVPDTVVVLRCFIEGTYYYSRRGALPVAYVRDFLQLLKSCTEEKKRIILANLHTKFDAVPRYSQSEVGDDDVPF